MKYPMFKVHMPVEAAMAKIRTVLESGFVNEGLQVSEFLAALQAHMGEKNVVLMNSCTSALTVAYRLCGVGPGTEVVTTPMTCVATNTPIVNLGATPVWADIDPTTGSIDAADIERRITPRTRAIVCVAWAGSPCDLEALGAVAKRHNLPLIQDAAHAFAATWNGQSVSKFADYTCYSFQAIKHLSSGDGGALVCRDDEKFALARKLKWFGYDRDAHKDAKGEWKGQRWSADIVPDEVGFKFNMNNIAAAIGLAQMPYIDGLIEAHRRNARVYSRIFDNSPTIRPLSVPHQAVSSHWVFTTLLVDEKLDRDGVMQRANDEGIGLGQVHLPNDIYSAFKDQKTDLPGVQRFADRQISFPCGWWLSEADCRTIAERTLELCRV
ncbi:MAG: DegT/DnrJ/EryC1/StrS family aminotransferase [Magnetospirillum sp.]|nr:DegT/DnrJ/EryC1/StrS family aminotransferase [Magnetospirillum sp.]